MANLKPYMPAESCIALLDTYGSLWLTMWQYANENYMSMLVISYAGAYKWRYNNGTWTGGEI